MPIAQSLLTEFEAQAPVTRKFLERLPENKLTWKPHPKSLTAGQLAYHLAFVPGGVVRGAQKNQIPPPDFQFPQPTTAQEVLDAFDQSVATVREVLPGFDDAAMNAHRPRRSGDRSHAARRLPSQYHAQPLVPAPRPILRLPAPARRSCAVKLGP